MSKQRSPLVYSYQRKLLNEIEASRPLAPIIKEAFFRFPRHEFLEHYGEVQGGDTYQVGEGQIEEHLQRIYRDLPIVTQRYEDGSHASTSSQPSFILRSVELLDVRPGHRVLEIGSGTGWLVAILSHLVGVQGRVCGREFIEELAVASKRFLAGAGVVNAETMAGDGAEGFSRGAPFERAIFTASLDDFPQSMFEQIAPRGKVLFPVRAVGFYYLMERDGACFRQIAMTPGMFVPFKGRLENHNQGDNARKSDSLDDVISKPLNEIELPLDSVGPKESLERLGALHQFLALNGFRHQLTTVPSPRGSKGAQSPVQFRFVGLDYDFVAQSSSDSLETFGHQAAGWEFERLVTAWKDAGMPSISDIELKVYPADGSPAETPKSWLRRNDDSIFVWTLSEDQAAGTAICP